MSSVRGFWTDRGSFHSPFRMILSGSSGSGKTTFAEKLLLRNDLFKEPVTQIIYFYPGYFKAAPVNWHRKISLRVSYQVKNIIPKI